MTAYHFKTNTLLKDLLGRDLINDDDIAVVELIKNSYDAKAKDATISFEEPESGSNIYGKKSKIIIADNGSGMSLSDIEDKWLNIAYSEKKLLSQELGNYIAGNKGVGRFSCDRLGEELDLITRNNEGAIFHLNIDWLKFQVDGEKDLTIQQIPLEINEITEERALELTSRTSLPQTGTTLVISKLRSNWNRERLLDLKRSLEKFLNPNQLFLRQKFQIFLFARGCEEDDKNYPAHNKINGEVKNQIFDKLKFKSTFIEASISKDVITTELFHEGEKVFKLVEENEDFPLLNDIKTVIYYLNPYKKSYFNKQTGFRLIDFGSIFLFLNGFRVSPYGDRGDDWLGLDGRSSQGTRRFLSSRDLVGRIEVQGSEEEYKPVSSREGLKRTDAFLQLKDNYFIYVLRKLERFVVDGLNWDSVPKELRSALSQKDGVDWSVNKERYQESWERKQQRIALSIMTLIGSKPNKVISFWFNPSLLEGVYETRTEEVKQLIHSIDSYGSDKVDSSLKSSLSNIKKLIVKKEEEAKQAKAEADALRTKQAEQEETISDLEKEKEVYRQQTLFLQSTSTLDYKLLISFHHQINNDSTTVGNYIGRALEDLRPFNVPKKITNKLENASRINLRVGAVAQYATKANFRSSTSKELTDIPAYIDQYLNTVAPDFVASSLKLKVSNSIKEPFEIKVSRIELSILIDNILSNADKAGANVVSVDIQLINENNMSISFIDDGKGLSKEIPDIESIFEIGVTTTPGSGLGLFHSKKIVEAMGGKITAYTLKPKGFEIKVELTR